MFKPPTRAFFSLSILTLGSLLCNAQQLAASPSPDSPDLTKLSSESAIVMDAGSGKILWSRNADEELYPASTTKIMTALLLLERCTPDEIITAPPDIQKVKESSMHLKPLENVRAKDMLFAILLRSANDGCYATACHISGSEAKFAELMNERARQIGCTHTHFDNANGLNDRLHYTSAHDLALIGREAMHYEAFRNIVRTEKTKINRGVNWKDLWMVNHNKILERDPTCDGIKTGWTIPAGHCFVGSATRSGWRVITVVMKSKSWENDTESLFNWAFGEYAKREEVEKGQAVANAPVAGGLASQVPLLAADSIYTLTAKTSTAVADRKVELNPKIAAPVEKSQQLGTLVLTDSDGFQQQVALVASQEVPVSRVVGIAKSAPDSRLWLGAGLLVGAFYCRGRNRRRVMRAQSIYQRR